MKEKNNNKLTIGNCLQYLRHRVCDFFNLIFVVVLIRKWTNSDNGDFLED